MKITIDIGDNYIDVLRNWASVSRTLDAAQNACHNVLEALVDEITNADHGHVVEQANWCSHEIDIIRPAIDHLHQQVRAAIWEEDRKSA